MAIGIVYGPFPKSTIMKSIGVAVLLFMLACQSPDTMPPQQAAPATAAATAPQPKDTTTLDGTWYLLPVLPSDTATGKIPWLTLNLAGSRFTGNTGCNSMHGKFWFSKSDSSLSFGDKFAISKKACQGYNEPAFLKSLGNTTHYKLRDGILTLIGDGRSELSRWMRQPPTPAKSIKT
jgi:heat shock protein HslJ